MVTSLKWSRSWSWRPCKLPVSYRRPPAKFVGPQTNGTVNIHQQDCVFRTKTFELRAGGPVEHTADGVRDETVRARRLRRDGLARALG